MVYELDSAEEAHKINTPLGTALTAASYSEDKTKEISDCWQSGQLSRTELPAYLNSERESCGLVQTNLQRAAELVNNGKLVAMDQYSEERRCLKLGEYLGKIVQILEAKIKEAGHQIEVICPTSIEVDSYLGSLVKIITPLVQNSLVHAYTSEQKCRLVLCVTKWEGGFGLDYMDDGKGISSQLKSKIFEPFVTTRRDKGSIGLGLYIIYNLVTQKLGGKIICHSTTKPEAHFEILLPECSPEDVSYTECSRSKL